MRRQDCAPAMKPLGPERPELQFLCSDLAELCYEVEFAAEE